MKDTNIAAYAIPSPLATQHGSRQSPAAMANLDSPRSIMRNRRIEIRLWRQGTAGSHAASEGLLRAMFTICLLWLAMMSWAPAHSQAFCAIREVSFAPVSNGVQIKIKADGILSWNWEKGSEAAGAGKDLSQVSVRFPSVRIGVEKTLYDINLDPVSTANLFVPQDAQDGRGAVLHVVMTEPSQVSASLSDDRQTFLLTVSTKLALEQVNHETPTVEVKAGSFEVTEANGLLQRHRGGGEHPAGGCGNRQKELSQCDRGRRRAA